MKKLRKKRLGSGLRAACGVSLTSNYEFRISDC
nr:MAG TPA: hypothetical protein [Caudoviricetes sp.]